MSVMTEQWKLISAHFSIAYDPVSAFFLVGSTFYIHNALIALILFSIILFVRDKF